MKDVVLHNVSTEMQSEISRLAEEHGRSIEEEAFTILESALRKERLARILRDEGLGSALQEIGREFNITNEFDHLRHKEMPRTPSFE